MTLLVIAEHDNHQLKLATLPVITAANELSTDVTVLVTGHVCTAVAEQVAKINGVKKVLLADMPQYERMLPENVAVLIAQLAKDFSYMLAPATAFGKNLLPRIAGLLDVGQVSDVIRIVAPDVFMRPIYAGNAIATVQSHDRIKLLTIRTTAYLPASSQIKEAVIEAIDPIVENSTVSWISHQPSVSERPEITAARVIISGGRGLGSTENFILLQKIADKLNAAIGASRAAVDAGFAPNDWQIGQTGKVVAPDLYIAVGISGAIQHVAGIKDSKVIVAINRDPDANIFQIADYGLVGDLFEILPEMEKLL